MEYLNEIVQLVPESYIKEVPHDREIRSKVIFYPGTQEYLPLEKLAPQKEKWFEAVDRAIGRIRDFQRKTNKSDTSAY